MRPKNTRTSIRKCFFSKISVSLNRDHLKIYILALLIRIPLLMVFGEYWDIYVFEKIAEDWFSLGLTPYDVVELDFPWIYLPFYPYTENWYAYPPGFFLIVIFFYYIYLNLFPLKGLIWSRLFIKIPIVLGDLLLAHSITLYLKEQKYQGSETKTIKTILFNPFLIYTSDVWGMFDSLVIAFIIYAFVFLERRNFWVFGALYGFSILLKQTSILVFPFVIIYIFRRYGLKKLIISILSIILLVASISLPFLIRNFDSFIYQILYLHLSREPQGFSFPALATNVLRFFVENLFVYMLSILNVKSSPLIIRRYEAFSSLLITEVIIIANIVQISIYLILLTLSIYGKKMEKSIEFIKILFIVYLTFIIFNKVSNEQYFLYPLAFLFMYTEISNKERDFQEFNKILNYLLIGSFFFSLRVFLFIPYSILKILTNDLTSYYRLFTPLGSMTPLDALFIIAYGVLILIVLLKTFKMWRKYLDPVLVEFSKILDELTEKRKKLYNLIKEKIELKKIKLLIIVFVLILNLYMAQITYQSTEPSNKNVNKVIAFYYQWYINPSHDINVKGGDWINSSLTPLEGYYDSNKKYLEMDLKSIKDIGGTTIIFFHDILNRQSMFRYSLVAETVKKFNMSFAIGIDVLEIYKYYYLRFKTEFSSLIDTMFRRTLDVLTEDSYLQLNNTKFVYLTNLEKVILLDSKSKFIDKFIDLLIKLKDFERKLAYVFIIEGNANQIVTLSNITKDLKDIEVSYIPNNYDSVRDYIEKIKFFANMSRIYGLTYVPTITAKFLGNETKTVEIYKGILTEMLNQFSSNHIIIFSWNNYSDGTVIEPTIELNASLINATKIPLLSDDNNLDG